MADDQYDAIAKVLAELPGRFGANVFSDRRRVVSVLSDRVPEARREIRVIGSCIDDGIFDSLASTRPDQVVFEIDRLAARIEGNLGVRKDIALPVVRACAHGLGRGPLPSAYAGAAPEGAMPATPGDSNDGWVGVSEPVQRPPGVSQPGAQQGSWVNPPSSYPPAPGTASQGAYGQPPQGYAAGPPSQGAYGQPPQGYPAGPPPQGVYGQPPQGYATGPAPQGTYGQPPQGYVPPGTQPPPGTYVPSGSGGAVAANTSRRNAIILAVVGGVVLLLVALFAIGSMVGGDEKKGPGIDKPPVDKPPIAKPPVDKPPVDKPPVDRPPVDKPPVAKPPVDKPPPGTVTEPEPADLPGKGQPKVTQQPPPPPPPGGRIFGDETRDFGVPAQSTLQSNVGSPTPNAIPVGKIISTALLEEEIRKGTQFLLVDVLEGQHAQTIVKARYIAYGGRGGSFNDQVQTALTNELNQLTNGRKDFPIVFFCQGVRCWESYNAVLRAWNAGYRNVYWYRGGLQAWQEAGFPMMPTPASR